MYEILKSIAALNGWVFVYARQDFQNLYNEVANNGVPHLFLDPVRIQDNHNESGLTESKVFSGSFLFVVSSDLDEIDYNYRYENFIKPLIDIEIPKIKEFLRCEEEAVFSLWKSTEIINILDQNLDGVILEYNIKIDND